MKDRQMKNKSPWISTADRLPEINTPVLFVHSGTIYDGVVWWYKDKNIVSYVFAVGTAQGGDQLFQAAEVQHWMPRPVIPVQTERLLHSEMIVSTPHLSKILKLFKKKNHQSAGYSFEFEDCGTIKEACKARPDLVPDGYEDQHELNVSGGVLQVYRDCLIKP